MAELEQRWLKAQPNYERKVERQGQDIRESREALQIVHDNPEHFQKVFQREGLASQQRAKDREKNRSQDQDRDYDAGGRSR